MTDHNLPPERRLDDATRAQMRTELAEAAASDEQTNKRSWLVPVVAAAAMVGVAALGTGLVFGGDDDPGPVREGAPAGSGSADPSEPSVEPTTPADTSSPEITSDPATTCKQEMSQFGLGNATEVTTMTYAEGAATLYTKGERWVICDDWATTSDGGAPTLIGARKGNDPAKKSSYAISENYSLDDDLVAQFFSGGPTLPGVESISYTFPDGHTEDAVIEDDMWLMTYLPTSGMLTDPEFEPSKPIHVKVTTDDGGTASYDLKWGWDTCAQVNHGC